MSDALIRLTVDGQEVAVPRGTNVIEAAKQAHVEIPHYCYHKRLSVAGNCRMCLVEIGLPKLNAERQPERGPDGKPLVQFMPKLQIACNMPVSEGMVVITRSPKVEKARQGVMEFLLINHPLDCPICDQAGECRLQEFAVDYGKGQSRFAEEKVHKRKRVPLGPKIVLDNERCIMCSRCERFMREVAKQDCLGFSRRGSHVELTCFADEWPDTNYDLNIVDICPVGALTSTDFRFRMRPWFLKETRSLCPNCATGCNTVVWSRGPEVFRQTPRDNDAVNQGWMCDHGRLHYKFIHDPRRLAAPLVRDGNGPLREVAWPEALRRAAEGLARFAGTPGAVAVVGSARATTEELFLLARLAREGFAEALTDCVARSGEADGFLMRADRNPNTRGAVLAGIAAEPPGSALPRIAEGIRAGRIKALLVLGENVARHGLGTDLLGRLEHLVVIDTHAGDTSHHAHVVLPGVTFAEKRGTFVNAQGRLQRFSPALDPAGQARPEWTTLAALLAARVPAASFNTFDEVFAAMAAALPGLAGLTWGRIGDQGLLLEPAPAVS